MTINKFLAEYGTRKDLLKYGFREWVIDDYGDTQLNELPDKWRKLFIAVLQVYGYFDEGAAI